VTYLIEAGYAPKSIDHIHDVLSAVLRSGVKWDHFPINPAQGVEMPRLKTVRPKWAFTVEQANTLFEHLPWVKPRAIVALALLAGARRGELFALRWRDFDEAQRCLRICEAVYEGVFDDPKTEAGVRLIPLPEAAMEWLQAWRAQARRKAPEDLIFSTGEWDGDIWQAGRLFLRSRPNSSGRRCAEEYSRSGSLRFGSTRGQDPGRHST
jgi:integrase